MKDKIKIEDIIDKEGYEFLKLNLKSYQKVYSFFNLLTFKLFDKWFLKEYEKTANELINKFLDK